MKKQTLLCMFIYWCKVDVNSKNFQQLYTILRISDFLHMSNALWHKIEHLKTLKKYLLERCKSVKSEMTTIKL
jgi:hypothetical protein